MQNILIIGGSRFVGPPLAEKLIKRGYGVTLFNRGKIQSKYDEKIKFIAGDRNNGFAGVKDKYAAAVDMCAFTGAQTQRAVTELKFDFFVHFGTAAAYKKTEIFPLTEESPLGDWPLWGDYNRGKVECERVLEKSGVKYASLRPVYILGPNNYLQRENFIYSRIKNNTSLILPGNGQAAAQFVSANDVAESIAQIIEKKPEGAFNCSGDETITLKGLVEEMAKIVGVKPRIEYNPRADGWRFNNKDFPFANENFIVSNEKIKNIGMHFTPLKKFLNEDYKHYYQAVI